MLQVNDRPRPNGVRCYNNPSGPRRSFPFGSHFVIQRRAPEFETWGLSWVPHGMYSTPCTSWKREGSNSIDGLEGGL